MLKKPLIMLDFETTGLSPDYGARITEVAALRLEGDRIVDRFVSLVNCNTRVPDEITRLTGITQAMVDSAPAVSKVLPELLKFIGNHALAAHNASFDAKFLQAESARLKKVPGYSELICSVKLSRRVFPGMRSYNLGALAGALGIRFNGMAHRAEADAEVSSHLIFKVNQHLREQFGIQVSEPGLLSSITQLSAAKIPGFLRNLQVSA